MADSREVEFLQAVVPEKAQTWAYSPSGINKETPSVPTLETLLSYSDKNSIRGHQYLNYLRDAQEKIGIGARTPGQQPQKLAATIGAPVASSKIDDSNIKIARASSEDKIKEEISEEAKTLQLIIKKILANEKVDINFERAEGQPIQIMVSYQVGKKTQVNNLTELLKKADVNQIKPDNKDLEHYLERTFLGAYPQFSIGTPPVIDPKTGLVKVENGKPCSTENFKCQLIVTEKPPEAGSLKDLNLKNNNAYVISGTSLFYVDQKAKTCTTIPMASDAFEKLKKDLNPLDMEIQPNIPKLSPSQLGLIRATTDHQQAYIDAKNHTKNNYDTAIQNFKKTHTGIHSDKLHLAEMMALTAYSGSSYLPGNALLRGSEKLFDKKFDYGGGMLLNNPAVQGYNSQTSHNMIKELLITNAIAISAMNKASETSAFVQRREGLTDTLLEKKVGQVFKENGIVSTAYSDSTYITKEKLSTPFEGQTNTLVHIQNAKGIYMMPFSANASESEFAMPPSEMKYTEKKTIEGVKILIAEQIRKTVPQNQKTSKKTLQERLQKMLRKTPQKKQPLPTTQIPEAALSNEKNSRSHQIKKPIQEPVVQKPTPTITSGTAASLLSLSKRNSAIEAENKATARAEAESGQRPRQILPDELKIEINPQRMQQLNATNSQDAMMKQIQQFLGDKAQVTFGSLSATTEQTTRADIQKSNPIAYRTNIATDPKEIKNVVSVFEKAGSTSALKIYYDQNKQYSEAELAKWAESEVKKFQNHVGADQSIMITGKIPQDLPNGLVQAIAKYCQDKNIACDISRVQNYQPQAAAIVQPTSMPTNDSVTRAQPPPPSQFNSSRGNYTQGNNHQTAADRQSMLGKVIDQYMENIQHLRNSTKDVEIHKKLNDIAKNAIEIKQMSGASPEDRKNLSSALSNIRNEIQGVGKKVSEQIEKKAEEALPSNRR